MADSYSETAHLRDGCRHRSWICWLASALLAVSSVVNPVPVPAAGTEALNRDQDLILHVDSRWPGNAYGGYFPLRVKLSNLGPPRSLTLVFEGLQNSRDDAIPKVYRAVHVEQQATLNFTISIPMVSAGSQGILRVLDETGAEVKGLSSRHSLPDFGGYAPRTSLLVISTDNLDDKQLQPFEDAAVTQSNTLSLLGASSGYGHGSGSQIVERDHVVIQPAQNLPINWIDYSGVDLVAVNWPDWNSRLSASERDSILKWTAAGGVLMIYGTGQPAAKHAELNQTLQLDRQAAAEWRPCKPEANRWIATTTAEELRTGRTRMAGATPEEPAVPEVKSNDAWKTSIETYSDRDWTLGQIYVFPENPFPGSASDWAWWLASLPQNSTLWPRKFGMSSRTTTPEFLNFLIPGVGSVPIFAFLCLITVFTLVIGPLNYYWLYKRRRLALMVITVPVIAGVTCILLFAYSLIADGFSIRSRVHSFTWLDQQRKSAVSLSRQSLYAPFAPSNGLRFSPECAVFPLWPSSGEFEGGSVDWSANDQHLSSAWFRSQTWTQFQTVENRDERGRLDYTPPADPKAPTLKISNGLSWDLDYLAIRISDTQWYAGGPVPAGATAEFKLTPRSDIRAQFQKTQEQTAWAYPEGVTESSNNRHTPYRMRGGYWGGRVNPETSFSHSLLVKYLNAAALYPAPSAEIVDWRGGPNANRIQPHAAALKPLYWAICKNNPNVQTGVKSAIDSQSLHLLFGTF